MDQGLGRRAPYPSSRSISHFLPSRYSGASQLNSECPPVYQSHHPPSTPMRLRHLLPAAALALAACSSPDRTANSDSALNADLTLAAQAQGQELAIADTALQPAPEPAPVKKAPPAPRPKPRANTAVLTTPRPAEPAPEPTPARPSTGTVASGTQLTLSSGARMCTGQARPGDKFIALLTSAAIGSNGAVIPVGSKAVMEVAQAVSGQDGQEPVLVFRVKSIETPEGKIIAATGEATSSNALERIRAEENSKKTDAKKVIGGAILGAIAGQAMGKDTKATVIGAAAGAAAGTVAAKATAKYDSCLPEQSQLRLTLSEAVQVPLS